MLYDWFVSVFAVSNIHDELCQYTWWDLIMLIFQMHDMHVGSRSPRCGISLKGGRSVSNRSILDLCVLDVWAKNPNLVRMLIRYDFCSYQGRKPNVIRFYKIWFLLFDWYYELWINGELFSY